VNAVSLSRVSVLAVLVAGSLIASARPAAGLEPGVHIDPGSPAAKEYTLPLNQARQTGASSRTGSSASAAFGVGIRPPGSGGGSSHRGSAVSGVSGRADAGVNPGTASRRTVNLPAAVLRSASGGASSGGDGSTLALLGGGVAILVLGWFGGMVMRRGRRHTPSV
jgi:hypothetical protein